MFFQKLITIVLLLVLFPTITDSRPSLPHTCQEPEAASLPSYSKFSLRSTFLRPFNQNRFNFTTIPTRYKKINIFGISKPQTCPQDEMSDSQRVLPGKDLCPVFYVLNSDDNRIPNFFIEAVCACKTPPSSRSPPSTIDCEQNMMYERVLRRTSCRNGFYNYSEMWEPIRMGCSARTAPIRIIYDSRKASP